MIKRRSSNEGIDATASALDVFRHPFAYGRTA
jgi:hypothetical protein